MSRRWIFRGAKFVLFVLLVAAALSVVFMSLWNWLMPPLFGLHRIGFWQALGLLILGKILFGGFRPRHGSPMGWRARMMDRWARMTPEEREQFQQGMRGRCAIFGRQAAERKV